MDHTQRHRTTIDYTGLYLTKHDYTRLYWNIRVYSSKEFKDFKKSVTLRQINWVTDRTRHREACASKKYWWIIYDEFWDFCWYNISLTAPSCIVILTLPKLLFLHHFNTFLEDPLKIYLSQFEIKMVWVEKYWFFHVWSHPHFYMKIQTISGLISWKKSGFGLKSGKTDQIEALIMKLDFLAIWVFYDFPKEVPKIFFFLEWILCDINPLKRP